jgi:hypothetical protein
MKNTFIYVISAGADRHKIGHARNPLGRCAAFQCGSYDKLSVLFTKRVEGLFMAPAIERGAHYLLRHRRQHSEWFTVSGEEAIEAVERAFAGAREPVRDYTAPGSPQEPPLGLRVTDDLRSQIEAYAAARGMKRHAAILELMEVGLDAKGVP